MSKADEMFKKLGYEKITDNDIEVIYKYEKNILGDKFLQHIMIAKIGKVIFSYGEKIKNTVGIGVEELQAINEKCRELGWLDE